MYTDENVFESKSDYLNKLQNLSKLINEVTIIFFLDIFIFFISLQDYLIKKRKKNTKKNNQIKAKKNNQFLLKSSKKINVAFSFEIINFL